MRSPSRDSVEGFVPPLHHSVRCTRVEVLADDRDSEDIGLCEEMMRRAAERAEEIRTEWDLRFRMQVNVSRSQICSTRYQLRR